MGVNIEIKNLPSDPDYDADQLLEIAERMAAERGFSLAPEARELLGQRVEAARSEARHFANAREVRNLLERAYRRQASRLVEAGGIEGLAAEQLSLLEAQDLAAPSGPAPGASSPDPSPRRSSRSGCSTWRCASRRFLRTCSR